jgi:hypothetical protein
MDKITAKTAGVRIFDPMYPIMESNGVRATDLNNEHKLHNHWKNFDSNTFIFSCVRDPLQRTISDFCYWANYGDDGKRTHGHGRDSECPYYTKENLENWLENKHTKNYQSKIISNGDIDNIRANLSRINLLVRVEDIRGNENIIRNKIFKELGISHVFDYYPPDFEQAFMPADGEINNIINSSPEIIQKIMEYNKEDFWLYSQASSILLDNSSNTES